MTSNYISFSLALVFGLTSFCNSQNLKGYENLSDINLLTDYVEHLFVVHSGIGQTPSDDSIYMEYNTNNEKNSALIHESEVLKNTLLLITHDTYCGFCIAELDFWNEWHQSLAERSETYPDLRIKMIVVNNSVENVRNFMRRNNYMLTTYQDQHLLIHQWVIFIEV
jgi:hypothetical protein